MFNNKRILAIIVARGGSKGVPGKNIRMVGDKPLIAWIIEAAKGSKHIDLLILSSDDSSIIKIAKKWGCNVPFTRPAELAGDDSPVSDTIVHVMKKIPGYDYVLCLQPTSPLTQSKDIDGCIEFIITNGVRSVVSVTQPDKSPYWMFKMDKGDKLIPVMDNKYLEKRRQDLPDTFIPNGAIYIAESNWFLKHQSFYSKATYGYKMPQKRSLDIDTEIDFAVLERVLKNV